MEKIQNIFTKIKELGQVNAKKEELREHCKLHLGQIIKYLPKRILNSDGGKVLDCVLNGFPDRQPVSQNKIKIVELVLEAMRKESTSLTHCSDVISRLCLELPRMPVENLVKWSGESVQSIVEDNDANMIWRDVLPECLNALTAHDTITHCGTEMSGLEYKQQCVRTLCQCNWKEKQLVQLAAMFKDMQLFRDDHKQVVNKLCSFIIDISPDSLPPLLHQLLKLCKSQNVDIVLVHLSHYFNVRLYSKLEPPPQDSESTTMDIDEIVPHTTAELSSCLSTCLYHISQGTAEPEVIRKYIKLWPRTQLLRSPFLIDLALALADKGADFRGVCLDSIRSAIEQRVADDIRSKESAWVKSVLPPDIDVSSVLKVLTTESANHRSLTVMGLIYLAFSLLNVRNKPVAPSCWSFGKLILIRLCKAQPETAAHVLSQLADRILGDNNQPQYADCLYILCKLTGVSIERCTELTTILECCQPSNTDYIQAAQVLDAVHPLINFSTRTRDNLLMVCRKRLYSRDSLHRCLALSGFLTILRHMKLSKSSFSSSQSNSEQYSAHSYLTQLTVDLHATQRGAVVTSRVRNETMCMEVVSILRRCLMQDAAVKQLLYTNLYDSSKDKTVLHESLLELVYEQLNKYLSESESGEMTVKFDKCVQVSQNAVLVEPISRLIYCISQFTQQTEDEDLEDILASQHMDTGGAYLKTKLLSVLDKLCESEQFGIVDLEDPGLCDLTPESKAKCIKVQQILQSYEALIAHLIMQWTTNNSNANSVYRLYRAYTQLLDQTKAPPKNKKGNKTLNETKDTVKSQKSQKSQKENQKGKGPMKMSNLVKDRAGPFKPLSCVWDLRFCLRVMELLYSDEVSWSSLEQRNQIRARRDFHHFVLRSVLSVLTDDRIEKRAVAAYVIKMAHLLYERFICRFQDMCDFDDQTALGCMEIFKQCLTLALAPKYSLKLDIVVQNITKLNDAPSADCLSTIIDHLLSALNQIESESEEEIELVVKKLYTAVVNTAAILLETPVVPSARYSATIIKLEDYIRTSKQDCIPLIPSVLLAGSREQQEAQLMDEMLVKLTQVLGKIDEEDTSSGPDESTLFPTVNETTGHNVLAHICAHIAYRSKAVEHLIARCKCLEPPAYATEAQRQRIERELLDLHKSIVIQLCQLSSWTSSVGKLRCSVGGGSEKVVASCVRLYAVLTTYLKTMDIELCKRIRLERLLKISGKKFSSVIDNLIMYLEASQKQENASKVLRDTKLIPRLVLEAEQFSKHVILLGNKAKVNFQQYLSLGTARDFRIKAPILQEVLNARENQVEIQEDHDNDNDINDAETAIVSPLHSDEEETQRKRRRVS